MNLNMALIDQTGKRINKVEFKYITPGLNMQPIPKNSILSKFKENAKVINSNQLKINEIKKKINLSLGEVNNSKHAVENIKINTNALIENNNKNRNSYLTLYRNRAGSNSCKNLKNDAILNPPFVTNINNQIPIKRKRLSKNNSKSDLMPLINQNNSNYNTFSHNLISFLSL